MKTFIAEGIEVTEVELVANGYNVSQVAAAEYARKLWARCGRAAKRRSRAAYGGNRGQSQPC